MVVAERVIAGPLTFAVRLPEHLVDELPFTNPVGCGSRGLIHLSVTERESPIASKETSCSQSPGGKLTFFTPFYDGSVCWKERTGEIALSPVDSVLETQERRIYGALRLLFSLWCNHLGGMTLHGCSLGQRGKASIFLGRSGAGKTTLVQNSMPSLVLGDDLVAILPDENGVMEAWPTPFGGRERIPVTCHHPLPVERIGLLEHAKRTEMRQLSREDAVRGILGHMFQFDNSTRQRSQSLRLACELASRIPVCTARIRKYDSAFKEERTA